MNPITKAKIENLFIQGDASQERSSKTNGSGVTNQAETRNCAER